MTAIKTMAGVGTETRRGIEQLAKYLEKKVKII